MKSLVMITSTVKHITSEDALWGEALVCNYFEWDTFLVLKNSFPPKVKITCCWAVVPSSSTELSENQGSESILNRSHIGSPGYSCSYQVPVHHPNKKKPQRPSTSSKQHTHCDDFFHKKSREVTQKWWEGWNISPTKKEWENWGSSEWRGEGCREILEQFFST